MFFEWLVVLDTGYDVAYTYYKYWSNYIYLGTHLSRITFGL